MQKANDVLEAIKGGLIVSCQALEDEPLHSSQIMMRMAKLYALLRLVSYVFKWINMIALKYISMKHYGFI